MSLTQYHKKRDFTKTTEPKGKVSHQPHRKFIIQKHAASHLHYDFRIELHGILKSWAIPKGPSLDPQIKRLAVHVEDHPLSYASFEGIIPKGQYGGGTVMLWDKGSWESLDKNPELAYEKGHLRFVLNAEKLNGRWDLIRFKENNWLLVKYADEFSRDQTEYDITQALDKSVKTQQTIDEIAEGSRGKKANAPKIVLPKGLKASPFPDFIPPELATLVDNPPEGEHWLHEVKFDGYRILAYKNGNEVILKSRNNLDWTDNLLSIAESIKKLPHPQMILDGEVVLLNKQGKSDFQLLQNSIKQNSQAPYQYFVFDILYYDQYDLRERNLLERKSILKKILDCKIPDLHYSDHLIVEGQDLLAHACKLGLEGIVSKHTDSPYRSKRSRDWLKSKCIKRQEFVIGGYTEPQGGRAYFGSLLLGVFNNAGQLEYTGHVGTGFNQVTLSDIHQQLLHHKSRVNPFTTTQKLSKKIHWVKPKLVCEVAFTQWTKEGCLRHPSFQGLRLDKKAAEVVREEAVHLVDLPQEKTEIVLTHPNKILYPEDKITKKDLLCYYEAVSEYILPYLIQRPLTLVRCLSNYEQCFYQRHFNKTTPHQLHAVEVEGEPYIYLNDKEGLLSLVQMGVLEIHPWGSCISQLDKPDIITIDLDPAPDVPWSKVVAAAKDVRNYLTEYQLQSFVKSTGGKGLHVVIPILPEYDWDEVKQFTKIFVQFLEKQKPNEYLSKMTKSKRKGKIFVDYLRNQKTATAIGTYSTRARLHAPVSTPLFWYELGSRIEDNTYTIRTLLQRLKELGKDPWEDFWTIKQSLRLDKLM